MIKKNGGVQKGGCASTEGSLRLDRVLRDATKELIGYYPSRATKKQPIDVKIGGEPEFENLHYKTKVPKSLIPGEVGGCQPDGGIIYLGEVPLLSIEGKTQGEGGNAIERASKNHLILNHVYPFMSQIMFCAGLGTEVGGPIHNYALQVLATVNHSGLNQFHNGSTSFFILNEETVTVEDVKNIVRSILRLVLADPHRSENAFLCNFHQERIRSVHGAQESFSLEQLLEAA